VGSCNPRKIGIVESNILGFAARGWKKMGMPDNGGAGFFLGGLFVCFVTLAEAYFKLLMVPTRTETTHGLTYSVTRAIEVTTWQSVDAVCLCLLPDSLFLC